MQRRAKASERSHLSAQGQKGAEAVILLAEDREEDVMLFRRKFAKANFLNPLQVVSNGEETIAYLRGEGKYGNREQYPLPSLLLLDLKMPRKDGFEVLEWLRHQPSLSALRVVVLTASEEIRDVNRAYQLGATSFLVKPVDFNHFVEMTQALKGYWIWMSEEGKPGQISRSLQFKKPQTPPASANPAAEPCSNSDLSESV